MNESYVYWSDLCGVPEAGSEWMLRDVTGIGQRELAVMANAGYVELVERQRTLGNYETRGATQQNVWRTRPCLWDDIRKYANVGYEVFEAFASRPEADLYVVDVFRSESNMSQEVDRVSAKYGLDIQLAGLGRVEPPDYYGQWAQLEGALQYDSTEPLRAVPVGDVVAISGFAEGSPTDKWFWEGTDGAEEALFEPTTNMVVAAVEEMLGDDT